MNRKALTLRDVVVKTMNSVRSIEDNASFSLKNVVAKVNSSLELVLTNTTNLLKSKVHTLENNSTMCRRSAVVISLFCLFLLGTTNTFAQFNLSGSGTVGSPYLIGSVPDWNEFVRSVNIGEETVGLYFKLTDNIGNDTFEFLLAKVKKGRVENKKAGILKEKPAWLINHRLQ